MSMGAEYRADRSSTSGARYHRVDTYSVYGGRDRISRASPKSAILITSFDTNKFSANAPQCQMHQHCMRRGRERHHLHMTNAFPGRAALVAAIDFNFLSKDSSRMRSIMNLLEAAGAILR